MKEFTLYTEFEEVLRTYGDALSARSFNCLKRSGIHSIKDFMEISSEELRHLRNLSKTCYEEIEELREAYRDIYDDIEETSRRKKAEALGQLDKLIGLEDVKAQVENLMSFARMQQYRKRQGMPDNHITLNMEFVGNPGTAKTTVARIIADIFYQIGLVSGDQLYEVGRADLVAEYTGQTAVKVKCLFEKAKGNVIFIDEAYSLVDPEQCSFGDEAITEIVKQMENNREDTIVIFAGYPKEMKAFMDRNPGLRSRVPFRIEFQDYTIEEMRKISEQMAKSAGFNIKKEAFSQIEDLCRQAPFNAGNGRFCRNLVDHAVLSFSGRHFSVAEDEEPIKVDWSLRKEDFKMPNSLAEKDAKKKNFGFCA